MKIKYADYPNWKEVETKEEATTPAEETAE